MVVEVSDARDGVTTGKEALSARVEEAATVALEAVGRKDAELAVMLTDDEEIRRLNGQWRDRDKATDVLSFSQIEGGPFGDTLHLGDVVISVETAGRQAEAGGWSLAGELNRLMVHGLLHLLGYDHEKGGSEEAAMKAEEARLATRLVEAGYDCAGDEAQAGAC